MRGTRVGSIENVVQGAFDAVGGVENAANDMGVSIATASYGTSVDDNRPGGLGLKYADRLSRMHSASAFAFAQHFSNLAGGYFQPLDLGGGGIVGVHEVAQEFSDLLSKFAVAHSEASEDPTGYTVAEAQASIVTLDRLMRSAGVFRAALVSISEGKA